MTLKPRHVFLKIEPLARYSPLAPVLCSRHYGRDCMFNHGHELGRVTPAEIAAATLDSLVYREYLDPHYTVPNTSKLVPADINEPPWNRRVPGSVLWARPGERLYIHVLNGDPSGCHSFHLHGLRYGIDSDGAWPLGRGVARRPSQRRDSAEPDLDVRLRCDGRDDRRLGLSTITRMTSASTSTSACSAALIVRDPAVPCPDHEIPMFVHQLVGGGIGCSFQSPTLAPGATYSLRRRHRGRHLPLPLSDPRGDDVRTDPDRSGRPDARGR